MTPGSAQNKVPWSKRFKIKSQSEAEKEPLRKASTAPSVRVRLHQDDFYLQLARHNKALQSLLKAPKKSKEGEEGISSMVNLRPLHPLQPLHPLHPLRPFSLNAVCVPAAEPEQPASVPNVEVVGSGCGGGAGPAGVLRPADCTDRGTSAVIYTTSVCKRDPVPTFGLCLSLCLVPDRA